MKLFLLPMLLVGAGWLGLRSSDAAAPCEPDCAISVECIDEGSCLVTCTAPSGEVVCQEVVECERPCDAGADESIASTAVRPCTPGPGCSR